MIVTVPLQLWTLAQNSDRCRASRRDRRSSCGDPGGFVEVAPLGDTSGLDPERYNDTNRMRLHVFANDKTAQAALIAVYDNLGKGASGAAVQNLNLMLGVAAEYVAGGLAARLRELRLVAIKRCQPENPFNAITVRKGAAVRY